MLLEAILLGLVVGIFIQRGYIKWLADIEFKGIHLPIIAFLIERLAGVLLTHGILDITSTFAVEAGVYVFLMMMVWANINDNIFVIIFVGIAMNALVIFANNGFMPVDTAIAQAYGLSASIANLAQGQVFAHTILTDQTNYPFLADIYHIMPPYPMPKSFSIGDVFLSVGVFMIVVRSAIFERS